MARGDETVRVQVWDLPTRLFHWALVAAVAFSWYSAENGMTEWHERSGIAILAMLAFRLIWGFVVGQWSRFADFVKGPASAWSYMRDTVGGRHPAHLEHNPLGGGSGLALLAALSVQAGRGGRRCIVLGKRWY